MQSGLLHTYMDKNPTPPPRPPPRSPTYKYPPPPRPPPPSATKPSFSPPPSGAQKYTRFSKADAPNVWTSSSAEDAKSKTNDFKAWEQMRHGQGPIPPKRTMPPKPQVFDSGRTFPAGRGPNGAASKPSMRRPPWEHLQDAGMPRTNTTRIPPRKTGFAPGDNSSTADEPSARSAYAHVSRSERPTAARAYTSMAPPPVHVPTAKKPDPLQTFKAQAGSNDASGMGKRASAPYHTGGGGKTFTNPILQRSSTSASPRDGHSRSGWYDSDTLNVNGSHARASSASSNHHTNNQKAPGLHSSSSSSSSSSDEDQDPHNVSHRQKQTPKSRRTRMPAGTQQRSFFTPNVTVEDAEDESMAPHRFLYTGPRRHSGVEIPTYKTNIDRPEGFGEHRTKHEAEQSQRPSTSAPTTAAPGNTNSSPRIIQRHRSFDESYVSTPKAQNVSATEAEEKDETPMYGSLKYFLSTPLPNPGPPILKNWSDQWPFHSPKKAREPTALAPPYWAVPSTLRPIIETEPCRHLDTSSPSHAIIPSTMCSNANSDSFNSFRWHTGEEAKPFAGPLPLRSQSSDTININFSPSGTPPPKFGFDNKTVPPPPCDHSSVWAGHSPEKPQTIPQKAPGGQQIHHADTNWTEEKTSNTSVPPSPVPEKYSSVDWNEKFSTGTFQWPHGRSSSRTQSRKRAGTPRTLSLNNMKRPGPLRSTEYQATFDARDDPPAGTTNSTESTGTSAATSRTSSDGSAMDIDPVNTPPSAGFYNPQAPKDPTAPGHKGDLPATPRQGPSLPPRPPGHSHATAEFRDLGLEDLANVAPFAPGNEGLEEVGDLRTSLPFQSRASPTRPTTENGPQRPGPPKPPKAPSPPTVFTKTTFDRYAADMTNYLYQWNKFHTRMLLHFQTRCQNEKELVKSNWISALNGEYDSYSKAIDEDEKVMKYWEVAQERHRDCIRALGVVRGKMMSSTGST